MLKEEKDDPKKQWNNAFITSINEVELFTDAIWSDGEHELKPRPIAKGKIEVSYQAPAATIEDEPKKEGAGKATEDCNQDTSEHASEVGGAACNGNNDHHKDTHFHDDDHKDHHDWDNHPPAPSKKAGVKVEKAHDKVAAAHQQAQKKVAAAAKKV